MHGPDVQWYVALAALLFVIGALGVMLRRSPLIILLSVEIMLNAANQTIHTRTFPAEDARITNGPCSTGSACRTRTGRRRARA